MPVAPYESRSLRRAPAIAALVVIVAAAGVLALALNVAREGGLGVAATQTRAVPPFSRIDLAGSNVVRVHAGAARSIIVHGDANLIDRITTRVAAGTLTIDQDGSFDTKHPMHVDVRVPALDALTLSGSGVIAVDGIDAARFTVALPGSGVIRASGTAERVDVTLGGSGDVQLDRLSARDAHATVRGSGRIVVTASRGLDAAIPGSGTIMYGGHPPRVTSSVTGSGAVLAAG
jgi:hypothetical protein